MPASLRAWTEPKRADYRNARDRRRLHSRIWANSLTDLQGMCVFHGPFEIQVDSRCGTLLESGAKQRGPGELVSPSIPSRRRLYGRRASSSPPKPKEFRSCLFTSRVSVIIVRDRTLLPHQKITRLIPSVRGTWGALTSFEQPPQPPMMQFHLRSHSHASLNSPEASAVSPYRAAGVLHASTPTISRMAQGVASEMGLSAVCSVLRNDVIVRCLKSMNSWSVLLPFLRRR